MSIRIIIGDVREKLCEMPDESVHCVVTSPPYFGLRDYGVAGQIGMEKSPQLYVDEIVGVFHDIWRVLRDDGTLWLNLGDSYARDARKGKHGYIYDHGGGRASALVDLASEARGSSDGHVGRGDRAAVRNGGSGLKAKDLIGIPWMVAFALRSDGWYLRQDIIWSKPNPMPESVGDRCTKSHEYLFMLSKSERYHYDAGAISEPVADATVERLSQPNLDNQRGFDRVPGKTNGTMKVVAKKQDGHGRRHAGFNAQYFSNDETPLTRNKRSVWEVATQPFSEAHFATFPPALIEPCILAGCPKGGVVLDPFGGAGTTGLVADRMGRDAILIELNPEYAEMASRRIKGDAPLFTDVA